MEDPERKPRQRVLFWAIWALVSPAILFFILNSPIGLGLMLLAYGGAGGVLGVAFIVIILTGGAIGLKSSSGANGFALGVAFCLTPFAMLLLLAVVRGYFSDPSLIQREGKRAEKIIAEQPPIPLNGLYVESISLKWALSGLLVDRQFPFIEGDVAYDKWLLDLLKNEQSIAAKKIGKKHYRLALGSSDSRDCVSLKNENDNPARRIRVQPETCLTLAFDNELLSDTRLHINLDQLNFKNPYIDKLFGNVYLEVFRNGESKPIVSIPYWPGNYVRAPKDFSPSYNETSSWMYGSFGDLMRKLVPRTVNLAKDGKPFVLGWSVHQPEYFRDDNRSSPIAVVRRAGETLENQKGRDQQDWARLYQKAQATGHPVVISRNLILLPKSHALFKTGGDFSELYATECCAFTVNHVLHRIELSIVAELLTREKRLTLTVRPELIPEEVSEHMEKASSCHFRTTNLEVADSELIATGKYNCGNFWSNDYEWVIPLGQLPDWLKS